jgi:hypothetical protein
LLSGVVLTGTLLAGCQQNPTKRNEDPSVAVETTEQQELRQRLIQEKKLEIGFSEKDVQQAWGEPEYKKDTDTGQRWVYTKIIARQRYVLKRNYNESSKQWEYREVSQQVPEEVATRMVEFTNGKVSLWRIYPDSILLKPLEIKPAEPAR